MKGDFTRSTFKKKNHYSSVRMQQGRVQVDADWNEQMDIQAHLRETQTKDVIGLTGYPKNTNGFAISVISNELIITKGRIYVDGILCELEENITYTTQPDYPVPPENIDDPLTDFSPGIHLVYLDVWQRHITALEDEYIREKALGGPDTATRTKTIWQVQLQDAHNAASCSDVVPGWQQGAVKSTGRLQARAEPGDSPEPCILPPTAGYRRLENQLYRIEIHKSGTEGTSNNPTFKWSRDNGCITAKVKSISGNLVEISHPVSGRLNEFAPGRWIEVTDDVHELRGKPGTLVKIDKVDGNILTVSPAPPAFSEEHNRKIRLWNSKGEVKVEVDTSSNAGYLKLEDGVEVKFEAGETYVSGDYWLIPARTATGDVEWPEDSSGNPVPILAHGIKHHYGKLALVQIGIKNNKNTFTTFIEDCRPSFPPLNEVKIGKGCCTVTVGDGNSSHGDTDSLQEAIGKVHQGGQICLLPGIHQANVTINEGRNITIKGCGKYSRVIPEESQRYEPIFTVENSQFITLENIDMATFGGTALQLERSGTGELKGIEIIANNIVARDHAVRVLDGKRIKISRNKIRMMDREEGKPAIFIKAEDSIIENNDICVVPAAEMTPPPIKVEGIPDLSTSYDLEPVYKNKTWLLAYLDKIWDYMLYEYPTSLFTAPGGIQVAGESEGIKIKENRVRGGYWNGITLGHIPIDPNMDADYDTLNDLKKTHYGINHEALGNALAAFKEYFVGVISNMEIEKNEIKYMGLNGIGMVNFFSLAEVGEMVTVDELTITGNTIVECLQQLPETIERSMSREMALAGIALADAENLIIRENKVEENGTDLGTPVCGIYIQQGDRIDISDNHILNNGPKSSEALTDNTSRIGGGIVIRSVIGKMITEFIEKIPFADGVPAVKIHDNIVTQPMGKALFIMALGPVSVVGNHLTSQGIDTKIKFFPMFAGSVMIINLGISRDLFALALISALKSIISSTTKNPLTPETRDFNYDTARGSVNYTNFAMAPATLLSLRRCGEPSTPSISVPGGPLDFSFTDKKTGPIIEILVYLPTGNVLFGNNRTTLDLRSKERDFAISSQLIFSLDDISYVGNQSECNSRIDMVLADVFTIGNTIRTNDNRFQEGLTIALFSLLSIGILMNTWTGNQATHCLTAMGIKEETQGNNLVLLDGIMGFTITDNLTCRGFNEMLRKMLKPGTK